MSKQPVVLHSQTHVMLNIARKVEIARQSFFFQPKLQVFPHSEQIWTAL